MEDREVRATATVRFVLPGNGLGLQFKAIRQEDPWNGAIEDLVRVRIVEPPYFPHLEAIEVERPGKSTTDLYIFRRPLPRNVALFPGCPDLPLTQSRRRLWSKVLTPVTISRAARVPTVGPLDFPSTGFGTHREAA